MHKQRGVYQKGGCKDPIPSHSFVLCRSAYCPNLAMIEALLDVAITSEVRYGARWSLGPQLVPLCTACTWEQAQPPRYGCGCVPAYYMHVQFFFGGMSANSPTLTLGIAQTGYDCYCCCCFCCCCCCCRLANSPHPECHCRLTGLRSNEPNRGLNR